MKKVIVGSTNPVKLSATQAAFLAVFPNEKFEFIGYNALSGVPDQPFGNEETKTGARNRALNSKTAYPDAGYYVGLEGGLVKSGSDYWVSAWMCVINQSGSFGYGQTSSFMLPPKIASLVESGQELGYASDTVFNETNLKHRGGSISILTNGLINREDYYKEALILALIKFAQKELYPD